MTKIVLYRESGKLNITDRWKRDTKVHEVSDWVETKTYFIEMDQGICGKPFPLEVKKFKVRPGDNTNRTYTVGHTKIQVRLPPFALANAGETSDRFLDYVSKNAVTSLKHVARNEEGVHPITQRTLEMAQSHCNRLASDLATAERAKQPTAKLDLARKELTLMREAIELWFAIRTFRDELLYSLANIH
jgi:hypothetical protein